MRKNGHAAFHHFDNDNFPTSFHEVSIAGRIITLLKKQHPELQDLSIEELITTARKFDSPRVEEYEYYNTLDAKKCSSEG